MTSETARPLRAARVFYGWVVVAAVFAMLLVSAGFAFYGLPVYLSALVETRGFSVSAVSGATAVFFAASGLAGLGAAALLERRDPRLVVAAGAVLGSVALLLLGRVTAAWQVYAVYALFGAGFALTSLVPGTTLVARWFSRRRSVALSIASTGLSAGGIVLTPFVATAVEDHGLPTVAPLLALGLLVGIVPLATLLLRADPSVLGLHPDGERPHDGRTAPLTGDDLRTARRSRYYRVLTAAHLLAMLAQVGGIAHLYNLGSERVGPAVAATAVSLLAAASLGGRLVGGWLTTRVSMRLLYGVLAVGQGASLVLLALAGSTPLLLVGAVLFGLTVGNLLMLHPLLLAERFGVRDYGRIYSRSQLAATAGVASGPFVIGAVHDVAGGYGVAFGVAAAASTAAALVLLRTGPTAGPAVVADEAPAVAVAPAAV